MQKARSKSFRPGVEALEDRRLMAAELLGDTVRIEASEASDQISVRVENRILVNQRGGLPLLLKDVVVRENGVVTGRFAASGVTLIECYCNGGNDTFKNLTNIRSYAEGGAGKDTLIGGSATDEFYGGSENDTLKGNGGLDYLMGEAGRDFLSGGKDGIADELYGGRDGDTFAAEPFGVAFFQNRDRPKDFNALEGDVIVGLNPVVRQ